MTAINGRAQNIQYLGMEQFDKQGNFGGVGYCLAEAKPYALQFANNTDVICLLLGDIFSQSEFEDDGEEKLLFKGETAAFHPRNGSVKVRANTVRNGFIAFSFSDEFQSSIEDRNLQFARVAGSTNNIHGTSIKLLVKLIKDQIRSERPLDPLEMQYLGGMVYLETLQSLQHVKQSLLPSLSNTEFRNIEELVDAQIEENISCSSIASSIGLPLRIVSDGLKSRTGLTLYQFVIERRIAKACEYLTGSNMPILEIALTCGFSSQQHMTSTLSRKLGSTPMQLRRN